MHLLRLSHMRSFLFETWRTALWLAACFCANAFGALRLMPCSGRDENVSTISNLKHLKIKLPLALESFRNREVSGPTSRLVFFFLLFFWWTHSRMNICLEARSPGGSQSHFFFVCVTFSCCARTALVLLDLKLLLPGLVQVYQSLVVEGQENEVQRICGDADDAQVLQDKVEDVAQVERAHHRQNGCRH